MASMKPSQVGTNKAVDLLLGEIQERRVKPRLVGGLEAVHLKAIWEN